MGDASVTNAEPPSGSVSPDANDRRDTALAATIAVVATLLGLMVLAWSVLYVTKGRFLKGTFERMVSGQTQRDVRVAGDFQLYFNPVSVRFVAEGLTISNPAWAEGGNFFESRRIDTDIATIPLIFGSRRIDWLRLEDGTVDMRWDAARQRNTWTFGDPDRRGTPFEMPVIRRAALIGTELRYRDPSSRLAADIQFDTVGARDTRFASEIGFTGRAEVRNQPLRLVGALQSPNATLAGGENQLWLRARGGDDTDARIWGSLPGVTQFEGSRLHANVTGRNFADLLQLIGVAIPETRRYRVTSAFTKAGDSWRFTGVRGRFGDSDFSGRVIVTPGEPRLMLDAQLATRTLDIVDAAPFIGYNPDDAARGPEAVIRRVGGVPRILPDATLRVDALRQFDARLKWTVRTIRARTLPISNVDLTLALDNARLTLSPLSFAMARGNVSSDIVIDARGRQVVTDYDVRLAPTPLGVLLAGWGVAESGTSGTVTARMQLRGTGDTLRRSLATSDGRMAFILPRGTFWTRNVQLAELDVGTFVQKMFEDRLKEPVEINCGLIGFTVRNGIAAADPILIDTRKNVMLGRGGFSFRDESLDLAFRADSKRFSLFSGQSPVAITGHFAEPGINPISRDLLARAGAGLGLAIVATPLAGVLAFVDVGDAQSTACGPVLSGARATAQRTRGGEPRDDVGQGTTSKAEDGKGERRRFLGIF